MLMAAQALADCRRETNPYLPQNSGPFGPSRAQMYGPDPCAEQEKELAGATTDHQAAAAAAQISAAPTSQDLSAAPAPQLSDTYSALSADIDPAVPITENIVPSPALSNMWSPTTVLQVMDAIAEAMEAEAAANAWQNADTSEEMEIIYQNCMALMHWLPRAPARARARYKFQPKNDNWIGKFLP
ncbi:nonstructural protein 2 [Psittacine chaphamaparvovirus 2]|uniref:Nonstructural protein 2 n=1 Tax=Psittacine parvovirus 2 TaxID=3071233 RepID=A0AA48XI80_9VIRU|nr:nonstructural protein 2 [Psittacine parvovirus 1]QZW33716.1 nonstructural protein 2 [Psittacine parvovirus 2]UKZ02556.1 nonstructural protein 2 [Psittacine chaphamaparvovirus 2]